MGYPVKSVLSNIPQGLTSSPNGGEKKVARDNIGVSSASELLAAKTEVRESTNSLISVAGTAQLDGHMNYVLSTQNSRYGVFQHDLSTYDWSSYRLTHSNVDVTPLLPTYAAGTITSLEPLNASIYWVDFVVAVKVLTPCPTMGWLDLTPHYGNSNLHAQSYMVNCSRPAGTLSYLFTGVVFKLNSPGNIRFTINNKLGENMDIGMCMYIISNASTIQDPFCFKHCERISFPTSSSGNYISMGENCNIFLTFSCKYFYYHI